MKISFLILLVSVSIFAQPSYNELHFRKLKIITVNAWSGLDYQGTIKMGEYESAERRNSRFKLLLKQLRTIKPDVIFLQEANPVGEYAERLADSLSFNEIHQVCNAGIKVGSIGIPSNLKEGIAILADPKLKLEYADTWKLAGSFGLFGDPLSTNFSESNFALVGKIKIESAGFYLINTHLIDSVPEDSLLQIKYENYCKRNSVSKEEYRKTIETLHSIIKTKNEELEVLNEKFKDLPSGYPFFIGGDFNDAPSDSALITCIENNKLLDTFIKNGSQKDFTWNPLKNENIKFSTKFYNAAGNKLNGYDAINSIYDSVPRRIDYIFLSRNFNINDIKNYKIILDSSLNGIHASDHFGVLAEVNVKNVLKNLPKESDEVIPQEGYSIEPLPIISYDTDTGFGYGAKAFFLNLLRYNESFDVTLFNSTKGERWYRFVFSIPDFELRQGKVYPAAVDLIVDYDKYIRNSFFGIGNKSKYNDMEEYTKEPLVIDLNLSRGFSKNFVGQFGLKYITIRNFNYSDTSKLLMLQSPLSSSKVNYSSINLSLRYDTRNSFINSSRGLVISGETEFAPKMSFTNTTFTRYSGWFQYYSMLFYPKTVFAFRVGLQTLTGKNLPVQVLLPIGGNNTLRGYTQDRFLDHTSALINAELRFPVYWRLGGMLGMDAGKVWNSIGKLDLKNWANNPVLGLRFYMDTYVIRLDVGLGRETTGLYFNFGHIF